ncbi:hypothetical protein SAMN02745127_01124 [Oceanospirillum multiglobuliferum]|uniref:Uncharacterized protein n=2 Tax=Oceanospirillum multiglobuliferum TaxID=64969 RepID=A0A1T4NFH2_9GAMM|nr:hypothetical protein BTE48_07060 [Oceanospirillum multiglobuliferum]SJZ77796.1 hypothetical protein SAMN02745127_01124 [Oceanospirillum multiglobuliferum]
MDVLPDWLPELIYLNDYGGDWSQYFDEVYRLFCVDFVDDKPLFRGLRLGLKRHPEYAGKSATFWHMISEGSEESERTPDLRRCERITWPRAHIENDADSRLKIWVEKRGPDKRVHIWHEKAEYLVVLNKRKDYILPWTAYTVERSHEKVKLNKRWERNKLEEL